VIPLFYLRTSRMYWSPPSGTRKRKVGCSNSIRSKGSRRHYGACLCGHTVYRGWGIGKGEPEIGHRSFNGGRCAQHAASELLTAVFVKVEPAR
jgi:hypothetical protein